ncbi:hypothetical protein QW180_07790 [Vibrio sinaloensis]|nr:hypothetical protein [Vibrio sinaloensis]
MALENESTLSLSTPLNEHQKKAFDQYVEIASQARSTRSEMSQIAEQAEFFWFRHYKLSMKSSLNRVLQNWMICENESILLQTTLFNLIGSSA